MNKYKKKQSKGFTLMEALVTTIVLVGLMSIALPQYFTLMQKLKNQEARAILLSLYAEQQKCLNDNNAYCANISQMDVEVPAPKNFNPIPAGALHGSVTCAGDTAVYFASMTSIDGTYTLYILSDGSLACTPCSSAKCNNFGLGTFSAPLTSCEVNAHCPGGFCTIPARVCGF